MKFCVIGLGRLGFQVATGLAENGMEVIAIDKDETIIATIADHVTHALCMHVTDEHSLRSVGIDEIDTVIVTMGENLAESILVTALLKKRLSIPTVIARATNEIHRDILKLVGADRVLLPEREVGIRLADNLSSPFMELTRLSEQFSISQITAPARFVEKTIADLEFFTDYNVHCIGLKETDDKIVPLDPKYIIKARDRLIFAGFNEDLEKIASL